jgi:transaldolase
MSGAIKDLTKAGVSVWLDDLSRPLIETGGLAKLVDDGEIVGITTNPTIFAKAIGAQSGYEDQLRELALRGTAIGEALRLLTAWDVREACDVLRPVFERSGGRDGRVSIEVDARISNNADRTAAEARGLWWLVDRPNIFIKIPATEAALPAISSSLADGISVNVTLIFSVERYKAVLESFLSGLEKRKASGRSLAGVESVSSFFLSRVDTEVDRRLAEVGAKGGEDGAAAKRLRGQAAIASARLAYQVYEDMLDSPRWQALAASGARPQRLLWASTGVKDKTFSDTRYVVDLVAPDTVNTMPAATLQAMADHGVVRGDTVRQGYDGAWDTIDELRRLGIDMADIATTLERQGVAAFVESWNELIESVTEKLKTQGATVDQEGAVKPVSSTKDHPPAPSASLPA